MHIFVLWRRSDRFGRNLEAKSVVANLRRTFAPLFAKLPEARVLQLPSATIAWLELPVRRWKVPFLQEDEETWALALKYPMNARSVLAAQGTNRRDNEVLPVLGRGFQTKPAPLLRDLAPPFSLIWASKRSGELYVQNDGLGQAPLFEYENSDVWALTNRLFALKALGIRLEPVSEDWAARATLGYFPMSTTGYGSVRYVGPGTQFRLSPRGLGRASHDVLSGWMAPGRLPVEDCLEMARCSLLGMVKAAAQQWERPPIDLSGGWDSRAVASSLEAAGLDYSARVHGGPDHPDVVVARQLARTAGIDLKVSHTSVMPPDDVDTCRQCIRHALLWQGGYRAAHKHKTFLANKAHLDGGAVEISGQSGEVGRSYYANRIGAERVKPGGHDDALLEVLMKKTPPFVRQSLRARVREITRESIRQADRHYLTGFSRLDFFYVFERIRRWASAAHESKPGIVFAPFLNPDYVRAAFAFPQDVKTGNPFHRHIIKRNTPAWGHIPYAADLDEGMDFAAGTDLAPVSPQAADGAVDWKVRAGHRSYDTRLYWKSVGRPLMEKVLAREGFWTDVFDPDRAREQWQAEPDELAIVCLLPDVLYS